MNTQILLKFKPNRANVLEPISNISKEFVANNDNLLFELSDKQQYAYRPALNPNYIQDINFTKIRELSSNRLINLDLYEDVSIPLNYTIFDVREPSKRKTNFSKTIRLPGTKNNNRIFNHVYEISGQSKFNPNLRTEVVILQNGVQVMRGNMQLKNIIRFNNDDVEYEVIVTGDLTSLFAGIGATKLSDLDFSEYNHTWNKVNIVNSWSNTVIKNGNLHSTKVVGPQKFFDNIERDTDTNRIKITTTTTHELQEGNWVRIFPDENDYGHQYVYGEWQVAERINSVSFTVNHPYPEGLFGATVSGYIRKWQPTGEGYVYGMISWGDDTIMPDPISGSSQLAKFPVTNFVVGFYIKEIWDKIFKQTNTKYESNFLNSDFFKRLVIFQKKNQYDLQREEIKSREFKVANSIQHSVRVAGFDTNDTGSYSNSERSYPFNLTYTQPYEFNSDIASANGILYNGIPGSEPYNFSTNKWKVTDSGKYDLSFNIVFQLQTQISDYRADGVLDPPTDDPDFKYYFSKQNQQHNIEVYVKLYKKSNALVSIVSQQTLSLTKTDDNLDTPVKNTFKNWTWLAKQANLSFDNTYLNKDDELWIEITYNTNLDSSTGIFTEVLSLPPVLGGQQIAGPRFVLTEYRGKVDINTLGVQFFANKANPTIVENSEVFVEQFLPRDISCQNFLISIIRMFNLNIESDKEIENLYYIEPRDDYYVDGSNGLSDYVDWTDKIDINSIEITPMGELNAKFYNFSYKEDNDYWNKRYREETDKNYGSYIKEIENDFITNEQKINVDFGSSVMINSPSNSDIVIPQIVQKDNDNNNKVTNTSTKILIWAGPRPTSSIGVPVRWQLERTATSPLIFINPNSDFYTYYPYVGTVDSPFDPLQDLNWFYTDYVYWNRARWTNENLYNKYWSNFIEEISDPNSKLIKADFRLTPKDIYNLDFKKIYVVNGNYLRLQKVIDYNAVDNTLTKCELLKLKSPSKFKRSSIFIDEDYQNGEININSNSKIIERPPQNYSDKYPISNYSESSLSGLINISLNGQNNIISANSTNISIEGNENSIGSNSSNISINGSGVKIAGGLKNVNVIGTDNIFVEESNVTYINGIRYKNGVAISKSNVIDGGINSPTGKISINTTPNVVDASEDVVIQPGSNTYEDVINAGQDRILPNLSNYNVSTQNSISPTTNYSGVAIYESGLTASLPQLIERRIDPLPYSAFNSYPS